MGLLSGGSFLGLWILVGDAAGEALSFARWFGLPLGPAKVVLLAINMKGYVAKIRRMPREIAVLAGMAMVGTALSMILKGGIAATKSRNA